MENMRFLIELTTRFIEILAVVLMVGYIIVETIKWVFSGRNISKMYGRYRAGLGRALLVGLELLVAADIIRTVTLDLTLRNIAILAALVLVRTFLGWTLTIEVEGRWPWQKEKETPLASVDQEDKTIGPRA